jgi:hypothetical protein
MDTVTVQRLAVARDWLAHNGSVLLYGRHAVAGGGIVDALVHGVDGRRVLDCRREHTDPQRRLGALTALFSTVDEAEVASVPPEHRRLLTTSIFAAPAPGAAVPSTAELGPAVLSLLRTLSRSTPLLLVLEAVHRLDRETRGVLEFVAVRADGLPIHMIAVEQVPDPSTPKGYPVCPSPLVMIRLCPSFGAPLSY